MLLNPFSVREDLRMSTVKKYSDSGTRTNIVCFRRLLLARVQLPGLRLPTVRMERSGHLIHPQQHS